MKRNLPENGLDPSRGKRARLDSETAPSQKPCDQLSEKNEETRPELQTDSFHSRALNKAKVTQNNHAQSKPVLTNTHKSLNAPFVRVSSAENRHVQPIHRQFLNRQSYSEPALKRSSLISPLVGNYVRQASTPLPQSIPTSHQCRNSTDCPNILNRAQTLFSISPLTTQSSDELRSSNVTSVMRSGPTFSICSPLPSSYLLDYGSTLTLTGSQDFNLLDSNGLFLEPTRLESTVRRAASTTDQYAFTRIRSESRSSGQGHSHQLVQPPSLIPFYNHILGERQSSDKTCVNVSKHLNGSDREQQLKKPPDNNLQSANGKHNLTSYKSFDFVTKPPQSATVTSSILKSQQDINSTTANNKLLSTVSKDVSVPRGIKQSKLPTPGTIKRAGPYLLGKM